MTLPARNSLAGYGLLVLASGAVLAWSSADLYFVNQGDFQRTIGFMLLDGLKTQWTWTFRPEGIAPVEGLDLASRVFGVLGRMQLSFGMQYHLQVSALVGQVLVLAGLAVLAHFLASGAAAWARALLFLGLAAAAWQAHNIALMASFYPEYVFFIALPLLLAGLTGDPDGSARPWLLGGGALLAGLAKVQFFYVPSLVLACLLATHWRGGPRVRPAAFIALAVAQLVCLDPLHENRFAHFNYHHSTFMGSYMVLSEPELRELGLGDDQIPCVGVDAWGNRASGPGGLQVQPRARTCYGQRALDAGDVLQPYVRFPSLLWRLPLMALPHHFTVDYFHVYPTYRYLRAQPQPSWGARALQGLSAWRDRWVTPLAALQLLAAGALWLLGSRRGLAGLATLQLFLALFIVSQVAVSLLGEGIRDLSKHLWAAQLCIDLMLPLMVWQLYKMARSRPDTDATPPG